MSGSHCGSDNILNGVGDGGVMDRGSVARAFLTSMYHGVRHVPTVFRSAFVEAGRSGKRPEQGRSSTLGVLVSKSLDISRRGERIQG